MEENKFGHLMIDLETMGNGSNSVICSIGAVEFNLDTGELGKEFYEKVSIQSCLNIGLQVDGSTIEWWLQQSEKARMELVTGKRLDIAIVLSSFQYFMSTIDGMNVQVWGNGARFDLGILQDAYRKSGYSKIPWDFRKERDVRTLVSARPKIKEHYPFTGVEHNPIDDCKYQIGYCCEIWSKIKC